MKNYITTYSFSDPSTATKFERSLRKEFPYHKEQTSSGMPYFAFAAREEPGVEQTLRHILTESDFSDEDFIALYFSRKDNPDNIKRVMVLGRDDVAEEKLEKVSEAEHNNTLIDLLETDIAKQKADEKTG